jgi:hypothetical protein
MLEEADRHREGWQFINAARCFHAGEGLLHNLAGQFGV